MSDTKTRFIADVHDQAHIDKHYRDLRRKHILRLFFTYVAPLILLIIYFQFQYNNLQRENYALHMKSIAENQSNILDLFLRERTINLLNLIDDPKLQVPPTSEVLDIYLNDLKRSSDAFTDIDFFDSEGIKISYAGPIKNIGKTDYSQETWFIELKRCASRYVITDIYLGYRKKPHFTIAANRIINGKYIVMRATLDPQKIYQYITSNEKTGDVYISIINRDGYYQLVSPQVGTLLEISKIMPPKISQLGISNSMLKGKSVQYAYCWLKEAQWAVIVQKAKEIEGRSIWGMEYSIVAFSFLIVLIVFIMIVVRSKKIVQIEQEKDQAKEEKDIVKSQLEHASKLASVGELASGIAHEINNPLAIIASEVGLIKDIMDPEFNQQYSFDDLIPHLDNIHHAAFRCRDITRKLLSFVHHSDFKLEKNNIHNLIDDLIEAFYERELAVSNIEIKKEFCDEMPEIITDANLIRQVLLNLVNNAQDAIKPPGEIKITTKYDGRYIYISVSDTGCGISNEQMEKIFLPFYTTKEVGKGTGLGLSVSYGIIRDLGGKIEVESIVGEGSSFTIILSV